MGYKGSIPGILCGTFVSITTIADWFWNASLRCRSYRSEEQYRNEMFLEPLNRVLPPPDLPGAVICAAVMFFLGYVSANLIADTYHSRETLWHGPYHKTAILVALIAGPCAGYIVSINTPRLPLIWTIYLSTGSSLIGFFLTYLALISPYQLHIMWKRAGFRK